VKGSLRHNISFPIGSPQKGLLKGLSRKEHYVYSLKSKRL